MNVKKPQHVGDDFKAWKFTFFSYSPNKTKDKNSNYLIFLVESGDHKCLS